MTRLRWLFPALVLLVWLGAAAPLASLGARLTELQENDTAAFLPDSAESTRVQELNREFAPTESIPAILLWEGDGRIDEGTLATIAERVQAAARTAADAGALAGQPSPPVPSADGEAVQAVLPLTPDLGDEIVTVVSDLRAVVPVAGTDAFVTGPGGIFADFAGGFAGIDGLLLAAAFGVVLLILLVVYRSPLLPLLVIGTAGLALTAANAVVYLLADAGAITVNGQSQGIAAILVVGAATDYGLLMVARFREELQRQPSRFAAMATALRRSWEPIVASGATVVLGVLCLLFSDLASNRGLGPVSAVSVTFAVLSALSVLPAARNVKEIATDLRSAGSFSPSSDSSTERALPHWSAAGRAGCWSSAPWGSHWPPSWRRPTTPAGSPSPTPSRASRTRCRARRRSAGTSTPGRAAPQ